MQAKSGVRNAKAANQHRPGGRHAPPESRAPQHPQHSPSRADKDWRLPSISAPPLPAAQPCGARQCDTQPHRHILPALYLLVYTQLTPTASRGRRHPGMDACFRCSLSASLFRHRPQPCAPIRIILPRRWSLHGAQYYNAAEGRIIVEHVVHAAFPTHVETVGGDTELVHQTCTH